MRVEEEEHKDFFFFALIPAVETVCKVFSLGFLYFIVKRKDWTAKWCYNAIQWGGF